MTKSVSVKQWKTKEVEVSATVPTLVVGSAQREEMYITNVETSPPLGVKWSSNKAEIVAGLGEPLQGGYAISFTEDAADVRIWAIGIDGSAVTLVVRWR